MYLLRSIEFSLYLLVEHCWVVCLFVNLLLESEVRSHEVFVMGQLGMTLTFTVEAVVRILHVFENTIGLWVFESHFK